MSFSTLSQTDFTAENKLSPEWSQYLLRATTSFMGMSDEQLDSFIDSQLSMPTVNEALSAESTGNEFATMGAPLSTFSFGSNLGSAVPLARPGGFKQRVKSVICEIADTIANLENLAEIVSAVLAALLAAFTTGIGAILLPVVVALVVKFIKLGEERFCGV